MYHGHDTYHGHGTTMPPQIHRRERSQEREFEALHMDLFRRAGWSVHERPPVDGQADVVVTSAGKKYVIELQTVGRGSA